MKNKEIPNNVTEWLKFIAKVVAYAAGLLMAGYGTAQACNMTSLL